MFQVPCALGWGINTSFAYSSFLKCISILYVMSTIFYFLNIVFILLLFILTLTHNVSQHYTHVQNINNTCIWGWHAKAVGFIETLQSINSRHGEQHTTVQHINYYFHPNCIYKNENMHLKFNIDMVINISTRWYNKDINQNYTNIWYCLNWISKQSWT